MKPPSVSKSPMLNAMTDDGGVSVADTLRSQATRTSATSPARVIAANARTTCGRGPTGRRRRRAPSLERLATAQAGARVRKREVAVLALEIRRALFAGCERAGICLTRTLLLAGSLLQVETLRLLSHPAQNTAAPAIVQTGPRPDAASNVSSREPFPPLPPALLGVREAAEIPCTRRHGDLS
jgi:hypothetical protein